MSRKYKVGILGATGAVGQKFIEVLENHPWFEITALAASERSAGKKYRDAANWIGSKQMPARIAEMTVLDAKPGLDCDFVFSGLDANVAGDVELAFAEAGYPVISNARNYRQHEDVPLLIPEVNPDHTSLIKNQKLGRDGGFIVTNPNCSTVGLVCALRPLVDAFGVELVQVTTMQALSGAGYPGVASLDAVANVIPYIGGEEEKMAWEPRKLLGTLANGKVQLADIKISAQCNRVAVIDGHTETVSLKLRKKATLAEVKEAFANFRDPLAGMNLPSAPEKLLQIFDDPRFPQPRRHVELGHGMTVSIGRLRECEILDFKFVLLVHNTVRGAAGGAVLNAELLAEQGLLQNRKATASTPAIANAIDL